MSAINVYTKVCLPCVMKKQWQEVQKSIWNAGYEIHTIRTTYDQELHKEATKLWGNDEYVAFVLAPNGEVMSIPEAKKMFDDIKDKLVKAGKSKPVRKGKKHVQGLRQTKRPVRVDSVEDSPSEIKVQTETR